MSLFKRRTPDVVQEVGDRLPPDLLARLEAFGQFEYDPQGSGVEAIGHPNADYSLLITAREDPDGFIAALSASALPVGGWTIYGAMRLAWHFGFLKPETPRADADALGLPALQFVRGMGGTWEHLNIDEKALWDRASTQPW
jgi:hypothetical protein